MNNLSLAYILALLMFAPPWLKAADGREKNKSSNLRIAYDAKADHVIVSWSGKGTLLQAAKQNGKFRAVPVPRHQSHYVVRPGEQNALFQFEPESTVNERETTFQRKAVISDGVYSVNIVGYVSMILPPGLSLIENPLYSQNYSNQVAYWWPNAPDGSQILKYRPGIGYEVSTYDGLAGAWSNPNLEVPMGEAFYFRNALNQTITNTFVGEVLQGFLTNTLPEGYSMKGSLVPQTGSINSLHGIPGKAGDEIRTITNDPQVGVTENISRFDGKSNKWVPDLILHVGQGFWIYKQQQQDWVRYFSAF